MTKRQGIAQTTCTTTLNIFMPKVDAPFSNIFFAFGAIFIMRTFYSQRAGTYYNGNELSYYTDTLREKPSFFHVSKTSDYYQFQLSYTRSKFIVVDNGCSIVQNDKEKSNIVNSLDSGEIVTVGYLADAEDLTNSNQNKVKAIVLAINNKTIVSADEVVTADSSSKKKYYLIGLGLIICGFVSLYLRKKAKPT